MTTYRNTLLDCLIIGGGAAGLTAAIYLSRFRRTVLVVDAGQSRLASIPTSHNYPGFPDGIGGSNLLGEMRVQAKRYGAVLVSGTVDRLDKSPCGTFLATLGQETILARNILLATGVQDVAPDFPDAAEAVRKGALRYCPVCDGFEAIGKNVAVIGDGRHGVDEALFIHHFADDLTLLTSAAEMTFTAQQLYFLKKRDIGVVTSVGSFSLDKGKDRAIAHLQDGTTRSFHVLYSALGIHVNASLAKPLGAHCDEDGQVTVDAHMQTSVEGLYAAGDVVVGLNQISVATGHAAIAATAVHNRLESEVTRHL